MPRNPYVVSVSTPLALGIPLLDRTAFYDEWFATTDTMMPPMNFTGRFAAEDAAWDKNGTVPAWFTDEQQAAMYDRVRVRREQRMEDTVKHARRVSVRVKRAWRAYAERTGQYYVRPCPNA